MNLNRPCMHARTCTHTRQNTTQHNTTHVDTHTVKPDNSYFALRYTLTEDGSFQDFQTAVYFFTITATVMLFVDLMLFYLATVNDDDTFLVNHHGTISLVLGLVFEDVAQMYFSSVYLRLAGDDVGASLSKLSLGISIV